MISQINRFILFTIFCEGFWWICYRSWRSDALSSRTDALKCCVWANWTLISSHVRSVARDAINAIACRRVDTIACKTCNYWIANWNHNCETQPSKLNHLKEKTITTYRPFAMSVLTIQLTFRRFGHSLDILLLYTYNFGINLIKRVVSAVNPNQESHNNKTKAGKAIAKWMAIKLTENCFLQWNSTHMFRFKDRE